MYGRAEQGEKGRGKRVECYNCHKKGHVAANCWSKGGGKEGKGPGYEEREETTNWADESTAGAYGHLPTLARLERQIHPMKTLDPHHYRLQDTKNSLPAVPSSTDLRAQAHMREAVCRSDHRVEAMGRRDHHQPRGSRSRKINVQENAHAAEKASKDMRDFFSTMLNTVGKPVRQYFESPQCTRTPSGAAKRFNGMNLELARRWAVAQSYRHILWEMMVEFTVKIRNRAPIRTPGKRCRWKHSHEKAESTAPLGVQLEGELGMPSQQSPTEYAAKPDSMENRKTAPSEGEPKAQRKSKEHAPTAESRTQTRTKSQQPPLQTFSQLQSTPPLAKPTGKAHWESYRHNLPRKILPMQVRPELNARLKQCRQEAHPYEGLGVNDGRRG
ncbi:hypothetical protein DFH06DRAFT_1145244 [Mycena polygramma]|nr:hypothetical protein DFH06DRAFT_1145244 [Mycena polygramma]